MDCVICAMRIALALCAPLPLENRERDVRIYWRELLAPDGLHASYLNCSLPDSWRLTMETSCVTVVYRTTSPAQTSRLIDAHPPKPHRPVTAKPLQSRRLPHSGMVRPPCADPCEHSGRVTSDPPSRSTACVQQTVRIWRNPPTGLGWFAWPPSRFPHPCCPRTDASVRDRARSALNRCRRWTPAPPRFWARRTVNPPSSRSSGRFARGWPNSSAFPMTTRSCWATAAPRRSGTWPAPH